METSCGFDSHLPYQKGDNVTIKLSELIAELAKAAKELPLGIDAEVGFAMAPGNLAVLSVYSGDDGKTVWIDLEQE
jgi:hypothetical protein